MAVSKTQNERPAIAALIDAVNSGELTVAQIVQNVATLTENLDIEISNRENADADLQSQIGAGLFSPSFTITQGFQEATLVVGGINNVVSALNTWQNRFRLGLTQSVTAPAGGSASGTVAFEESFDSSSAEVAVFPVCVGSDMTLTDLSCKVTRSNYKGFSFDVHNGTQAEVTIKVGFLAVKVN